MSGSTRPPAVKLLVSKQMDVVVGDVSFRSFTEYGVITDEQT